MLILIKEYAIAQEAVYVKKNGEFTVEKDSADFKRVVYELDSSINVFPIVDFYLTGKIKSRSFVTTVDPPIYQGQKVDYYPNGKTMLNAHYEKGKMVGDVYSYYPNGKLYAIKECRDTIYNPINGEFERQYLIKSAKDSLGNDIVLEGKGYYVEYDKETLSKVIAEGSILNGQWDREVKGKELNEGLTYVETYELGKLILGVAKDNAGKEYTYKEVSVPAGYKGGMDAFYKYLMKEVRYPHVAQNKKIQGKVFLRFVIENNGLISHIQIINKVNSSLADEAIRVVNKSGVWEPAKRRGKAVRSIFRIPINFSIGN